ncbi:MAG: MarR family winged helix-turn-helix transcriptional regulator [Psychrobium sp.]
MSKQNYDDGSFNLDTYIPFNILYTELMMYRSGRKDMETTLVDGKPLSQGELRVLVCIYFGKATSPSDFTEALGMDKALVTRNINSLSAKHLISLTQDEADKRRKLIGLTERGREVGFNITKVLSKYNDFFDSAITKAEKKSLLKILSKLNAACRE